jgi:hypothetical protein
VLLLNGLADSEVHGELTRNLRLHKTSLKFPAFALHSNGLTGCLAIEFPRSFFLIWVPPLLIEIILCLLMLYKAWRTYRDDWRSPLLNLLIRDRFVLFPYIMQLQL